jgi:hypothetical protein
MEKLRAALAALDLEVLPPASEEVVAAFESRLGVTLPPEYRAFLREVSEGVAIDGEPALYSMEAILLDLGPGRGIPFPPGRDPTEPFPYSSVEAAALRAAMAKVPSNGSLMEDRAFMGLQKPGSAVGSITLAGHGGNDFSVLVVTGEERGTMWRTGELDHPEGERPLGFLAWFELWAPSALPGFGE